MLNDSPLANRNSPLRILTVANVPLDPNSGAAGTVYYTNIALRELGHQVDEIWADQLGPRWIAHGNLHSLLEQPRVYRREVVKAVASNRYDVVQISQPQGWLAAKALKQRRYQGLVVNRSHGVELRVNEVLPQWHRHFNVPESRFPPVTKFLQRLLDCQWHHTARWFDVIVTGCSQDRQCVLRRTLARRVEVIPHGIHQSFLDEPVKRSTGQTCRALHVGQYAFFKGSSLLIDILNKLLSLNRQLEFTWVCSKSHHQIIRDQLAAEIQDRVNLVDWMPQTALLQFFDSHNIFVFPSFFEGFGKAPFEAMARGLCVVASDDGGMHDLIRDGQSGFLCPVGSTESFVSKIQTLYHDSELRNKMGLASVQVAKLLSWANCAAAYEQLYQQSREYRSVV
ncbi:MAG: glycosyltransferase family 4 protein [Planctomycetaceae bacterium]|nr:glycosyltransferase family 4 protein [Planctomycetaceae bacterium]MCA9084333.1 glycosyltransferase family 4 protein [Planctomycetaceae bacterium]